MLGELPGVVLVRDLNTHDRVSAHLHINIEQFDGLALMLGLDLRQVSRLVFGERLFRLQRWLVG